MDQLHRLLSIKKSIQLVLNDCREDIDGLKVFKQAELDTLLDVGYNLSWTNQAPNGWNPGMPLLKGHPPAPQPDEMRSGSLENYSKRSMTVIDETNDKAYELISPMVRENISAAIKSTTMLGKRGNLETTQGESAGDSSNFTVNKRSRK